MSTRILRDWKFAALVGINIILAISLITFMWLNPKVIPAKPNQEVAVAATPAPEIAGETKIDKPIATGSVKVYKPAIKTELKLPASVIANENIQVAASSRVSPNDHPQTVTSTVDMQTGEVTNYVKEEPYPWLAKDTRTEIGLYAGIKNGNKTIRLEGRQGLIQIKALHVGVIGTLDQSFSGPIQADYFVGAGVWTRW